MATLSQRMVLKEGDCFLLSSESGEMDGTDGSGLYHEDTRYLSTHSFRVNGQVPSLLGFSAHRSFMGTIRQANDILHLPGGELLLPQTLSISRSRFISEGLHERIEVINYNRISVPLVIQLHFGSDFRDIFDIRGFRREGWGELKRPEWDGSRLLLGYMGMDGVERSTGITFDRPPDGVEIATRDDSTPHLEPSIMWPVVGAPSYHITIQPPIATATWRFALASQDKVSIAYHVVPLGDTNHVPENSNLSALSPVPDTYRSTNAFTRAVGTISASYRAWEDSCTSFLTSSVPLNAAIDRSLLDLRQLSNPMGEDFFPTAGIPWYACPFGRDSLITALQVLPLNPSVATGTLRVLARYQGTREDPWREEQPGKILHELRTGEMARLNMVPHSPYYGTVDATPLFVLLFVETMRWLDSDALYKELLPNVMRALEWIDIYGDVDRDGFVEYVAADKESGIRNQVWKDSEDSTQFPDGSYADTPLAAVEVQGYVYAAKLGISKLLRRKGNMREADKLEAEAHKLREQFNKVFWMTDAGFFAQGLDSNKRQIPTITSNPGHCLWCGIVDDDKARATVARMMQPDMLSGWGIRTISSQSPSYNPMSYHNGSIWPHDNSIIAAGMKRYGYATEANSVISQVIEAAQYFLYNRLPELYCGFEKSTTHGEGPTEYPVSCSPQAWAAGAPILMISTLLGLQPEIGLESLQSVAQNDKIVLDPTLPDWLDEVEVRNLRVGEKRINFELPQ